MAAEEHKQTAITIARHGQPDLNRFVKLNWREYEDWWVQYDLAGLKPGQIPPESLKAEAAAAKTLFASTLRRAIETARAAAPDRDLVIDARFVEAPLPPPPMAGKFDARTWGVFARCSWWLGFHRGRESRQEAELRAEGVAEFLIEAAQSGPVVLFAHGWFNRMIRPHLKARGWRCVRDGGDWYWSWRRYELKNPR